MAQIETWLKTDLKQIIRVKELDGQLFTADNQANLIGVIVTNKGVPVTLSGNVTGYIIRSDGETVVVTGSTSSNKAYIVLPASAYVKAGPVHIVIKIGSTTICACTGYVGQSSTDTIVDPGHVIPSLQELLDQIAACQTATTNATNAASSANSAAASASSAASNANQKATAANNAATAANTAAAKIDGMTVAASGLAAGASPTAEVSDVSGHKHIVFGIPKGDKGDPGKDFEIRKTFASIAAMLAYDPATDPSSRKMRENDFAMIDTGSVQDADTGKLYCYEPETQEVWRYIGDLSGSQGIKGETGTGIANITLNQDYTLTITMDDGITSYTTPSIRGAQGDPGDPTELIDDTAGESATDKVWSANKLFNLEANTLVKEITEQGYFHDGIPVYATFYPNVYTQDIPVRYAEGENLFEYVGYRTGTEGSVDKTADGRFLKVKNTSTGGLTIFYNTTAEMLAKLAGKTVNICIYLKKELPWANGSYFFVYNGKKTLAQVDYTEDGSQLIGWTVISNVTIPSDSTYLMGKFNQLSGSAFSEGDFFWVGIYEATPVVTETLVTTDPVEIAISGLSKIDTMMHRSTAEIIVPTKRYVDEHTPDIIGFLNDNVYAMPEKFGAVGDGVTDDGTALQACVAYAASSGKPIRGFGIYKTSSPIVLQTQYMDVYFHAIDYSGNGAAVEINNMDIKFQFHTIVSAATGIKFGHRDSPRRYGRMSIIKGNRLQCSGNAIYIEPNTMYNTIEIRYVISDNGNCINTQLPGENEINAGEYIIQNCTFACPEGYATYNTHSFRMYNCTVEGNCKYGFLNPLQATIVGCRHREQTDGMKLRIFDSAERNNGPLFIFTNTPSPDGLVTTKYISSDPLQWFSIDVSAVSGFDPITSGDTDDWLHLAYSGMDFGISIRGVDGASRKIIGHKMFFIGNNKVYVPEERTEVSMTLSECNFALLDDQTDAGIVSANAIIQYLGTDYTIDVSHSDIYLGATHGAVGYNDLTFTQRNGNTCTVYDKLGNEIFDGTNLGNGTWHLKCIVDHNDFGRLPYETNWWCYDGTNEKWVVERVPDVVCITGDSYQINL